MSGQDDTYSHGDGQPMIVVSSQQSDDAPVAVSRRSAALMWMGALLGGTFIASIFLFVVYIDASKDVRDLRAQLATASSSLSKTQSDLSAMSERAKLYDDDNKTLNTENNELRTRLHMPSRPRPAPRQTNPFADTN
jgi:hypothetical protein